jgi:hypothetical protein
MAKAIDTWFDGQRYRSRLEARWAVFFKVLGIKSEYEVEGYTDGATCYLCDFRLPDYRYWIEIKPSMPDADEYAKADMLCEATGEPVFIFHGQLRDHRSYVSLPGADGLPIPNTGYRWTQCPHCNALDIRFDGIARGLPCRCVEERGGETVRGSRLIEFALQQAATARFEHGDGAAINALLQSAIPQGAS